jgi:Mg-chelatase subunit ChlD
MGSDQIAVVGFFHDAHIISLSATPDSPLLAQRVASIPSRVGGRGTNIAAGLRKALEVSRLCPKGSRRRIFLLSDGEPNWEVENIDAAVDAIAAARININCIGFGECDRAILKRIASRTHHGRYVEVSDVHSMVAALRGGPATKKRLHRSETAIIVVDLSLSMNERDMGGLTRAEAVRDAIRALCEYKLRMWS